MPLLSIAAGESVLDSDTLNSFIKPHSSDAVYKGVNFDFSSPATTEHSLADKSLITRFTTNATGTIGRVELNLAIYGTGSDLEIEIRGNNFNTNGSNDGTLYKKVKISKKILVNGTQSIPINLRGLSPSSFYWLVVKKTGDATNHIRVKGGTSQDANHPTYYRNADTGAWAPNNTFYFYAYDHTFYDGILIHAIYGQYATSYVRYNADYTINSIRYQIQAIDGSFPVAFTLTPTNVDSATGIPLSWGES
jgi:hypothetical protein